MNRPKSEPTPRGGTFGLSEAERCRIACLLGRDGVDDVRWLTVEEVAETLEVTAAEAGRIIAECAAQGSACEWVTPLELASDTNRTTRSLRDLERRGLPALGEWSTKRYPSFAYEWLERWDRLPYSAGRGGFKRKRLSALSVVRRSLGWPEDE